MSATLDRLVREARQHMGRREAERVDWQRVESGLLLRIAAEQRAELAPLTKRGRVGWTLAGVGLAIGAIAAVVVGRTHEGIALDAPTAGPPERAGNVVSIEGGGELLVGAKVAAVGTALQLGDVLESRGAQTTVERPGKLLFAVERGSRAAVTHVQGALILALEAGAIEAQVVPIARGEAFAVDVGRSRVAVHGTHLRVARTGDRVVVDLNEGVVAIGEGPRVGSTLGALVNAPAHAEFVADRPLDTLVVSHDPAAVRAPLSLGTVGAPRAPGPVAPPFPGSMTRSETIEPHPDTAPAVVPAHPEPRSPSPLPSPAASAADPNAEATLAAAVRACLAERPSPENVTISVSTTLNLALRDDGSVRSARFDPPVAPDVNACAVQAIYKTRFARSGDVSIAVDFKVPSSAP